MENLQIIRVARTAFIFGGALFALPLVMNANSSGPPVRHTGAPGDAPQACATAGCHTGTAVNGGGGRVTLTFEGGDTYVPGQRKRVTVTIEDAANRYGFQATVRLVSDLANGQAGRFVNQSGLLVLCSNDATRPSSGNCPASAPVEFLSHASSLTSRTVTFEWEAPATNVGDVRFYVAGNAANGNGSSTGDRIYTTNVTLTPAAAGNRPVISSGGIIAPGGFGGGERFSPGQWVEIYGTDFATGTREWAAADFQGANAPRSLDGISVLFGTTPAPIRLYSPGQINVQIPQVGPGPQPVIVRTPNGESAAANITIAEVSPAVIIDSRWRQGTTQFAVLQTPDFQTFIGPAGLIPGVSFRPARPGERIILFGVGFGSVDPAVPPGTITGVANRITRPVVIELVASGGARTPVTLEYQGLAGNFVGLYQFNLVIPDVPNGNYRLAISVGGVAVPQEVFVAVQR
jgi:uncharacterized protein (TIGR03437 family)